MNGYQYGYFLAGSGAARPRRMTLAARIRLRRRRKRIPDLAGLKAWRA